VALPVETTRSRGDVRDARDPGRSAERGFRSPGGEPGGRGATTVDRNVPRTAAEPPRSMPRAGWVDLLKGVGIVAVVWIHAFTRFPGPMPPVVDRLAFLTRFAVPGFLLAAGFLQACGPRQEWSHFCARRLSRLIAPYAVASVLALALRVIFADHRGSPGGLLRDLLTGGGWGIYYFVPVLLWASVCGEWLFRFPRLAWPVWTAFADLGLLNELQFISFHSAWWEFSSPLRWWGYFFAGWLAAVHRDRIDALPDGRRRAAGLALLLLGATAFATNAAVLPPGWSRPAVVLQYPMMYALIVGTMLLAWKAASPAWLRWLSEASYPIYLYHFFPIFLMLRLPGGLGRDAAAFVIALAASCIGVAVVRRLCGPRARLLFG